MSTQGKKLTIKFWTPQELEYFQQGLSDKEIEEKTGRTRTSISVKRVEVKKKGMKAVLATAIRISKKIKGVSPKKGISEKVIAKAVKSKVIADTNLHFVVNGLDLYVANTCTNVLIGKNKVEVNF